MNLIQRCEQELEAYEIKSHMLSNAIKRFCGDLMAYNYQEQLEAVKVIEKLIKAIPLTPINLDKSNFIPFYGKPNILQHKRTQDILWDLKENRPFNACAYGYTVIHQYILETKEEVAVDTNHDCDAIYSIDLAMNSDYTIRLYLSHNGILNGEYIDFCYLRNKDTYNIHEPIKLDVNYIEDADTFGLIFIDKNNPKLKALMDFYDCPIKKSDININIKLFNKLPTNKYYKLKEQRKHK